VDLFWSFIKMISALAVILGLLIGAMYYFRRFMKRTGAGPDDGELIRVVATRYLGPKSSILVMDIVGQVVAVGVSDNRMTLLATITEPGAIERLKRPDRGRPAASFTEQLMSYRTKWNPLERFNGKGKGRNV